MTPAEKLALRKVLLAFWRFWNAKSDEGATTRVDEVVTAIEELKTAAEQGE